MVQFHMLGIVSSCAIVTLSLRCDIFQIFDFKNQNVVTLKMGQSPSRSLEMSPRDREHTTSY